ncbi:hypothetical protein ABPG72_006925 [Tetrahymena utriculariae]
MKSLFLLLIFFAFASCALYFPIMITAEGPSAQTKSTWNYNGAQYFYSGFQAGQICYIVNDNEKYIFELLGSDLAPLKIPLKRSNNTTETGIIFYSQFQQNEMFVILDCTNKAAQKLSDVCIRTKCLRAATRTYQNLSNIDAYCLYYYGFGTSILDV